MLALCVSIHTAGSVLLLLGLANIVVNILLARETQEVAALRPPPLSHYSKFSPLFRVHFVLRKGRFYWRGLPTAPSTTICTSLREVNSRRERTLFPHLSRKHTRVGVHRCCWRQQHPPRSQPPLLQHRALLPAPLRPLSRGRVPARRPANRPPRACTHFALLERHQALRYVLGGHYP